MYLVVDECGNVEKLDNKGLDRLLVREIIEDIRCNRDDEDIVDNSLEVLKNMITKDKNVNVIKELQLYGWCVKDLMQLHRDLCDFNEFVGNKYKFITETLELIAEETTQLKESE